MRTMQPPFPAYHGIWLVLDLRSPRHGKPRQHCSPNTEYCLVVGRQLLRRRLENVNWPEITNPTLVLLKHVAKGQSLLHIGNSNKLDRWRLVGTACTASTDGIVRHKVRVAAQRSENVANIVVWVDAVFERRRPVS